MPVAGPSVLAVGAWFKNTVCALRDGEAALSTTVGDLNTPEACASFDQACDEMRVWLQAPPAALACDLHPDYYSTRWAEEQGLPLMRVQHHAAHLAAILAEHRVDVAQQAGLHWDTIAASLKREGRLHLETY